jgi:hypothetical protein
VADRTSQREQDAPRTPDELEQRRRADGSLDEPDGFDAASDTPLTPDVLEQRRRADGGFDASDIGDDGSDTPLTPDVLEQRQVVEDDEEPPTG